MTYILQHDEDALNCEYFASEAEAREWAETYIGRSEVSNWTLMDPEGGRWELYF